LEPVYRGVIETGLPSIGRELRREDPVVPGGAAHYLASHYPIRGARGEVLGVGVIVQDITERKRMEAERELLLERERRAHAAVQAERQRLYGLFMQAPAVIAVSRGPDHVFEMANPAFRALSGGVDPIGKSLREIRAELGRADGFVGFHDDIYASGQPFVAHEYPLTVPIDGTEGQQVRYYSFVIQPTRDAEGHVDGLLRHGVDVTEQVVARRRAEELATQLGNQQQWLEAVLNLLPVPLLFIEPATANVTFANVAAQEMAGGEIPRFVAANAEHTVHACTDDEGQRIADAEMPTVRVARGETLRDFTMNWHLPQGSKPLLLSGDTLPSMHGHAELAVLAFQDISRLKTIQAELTEAVRVRDEFMSVAGHELRTPLAALALQIQSLQRLTGQSERDDRIHARLGKAIRQVERLSELVTELLDVSRIASGTLELHVERFDLAALVVEVVARLEDSATQAGVRLVFNPVTEVFGEWDRSRIDQVTTNLLINAIKYGDKKPVVVVVEGKNDHGRITVRDEGIGIAHDAQERVFERFERAVSERHYGGLGVGLWLCREIVHAHGGRIALHSEPGVGTTVTADFPQRFSKEQV
jgi:signal transduction histidine kinase